MAEQLTLAKASREQRGRRLNLVSGDECAPAGATQSLADYLLALAPGAACFACGTGSLTAAGPIAEWGETGRSLSAAGPNNAGRLVCDLCGAEVEVSEAA